MRALGCTLSTGTGLPLFLTCSSHCKEVAAAPDLLPSCWVSRCLWAPSTHKSHPHHAPPTPPRCMQRSPWWARAPHLLQQRFPSKHTLLPTPPCCLQRSPWWARAPHLLQQRLPSKHTLPPTPRCCLQRFPIESRGRRKKLREVGLVTSICAGCFSFRWVASGIRAVCACTFSATSGPPCLRCYQRREQALLAQSFLFFPSGRRMLLPAAPPSPPSLHRPSRRGHGHA